MSSFGPAESLFLIVNDGPRAQRAHARSFTITVALLLLLLLLLLGEGTCVERQVEVSQFQNDRASGFRTRGPDLHQSALGLVGGRITPAAQALNVVVVPSRNRVIL